MSYELYYAENSHDNVAICGDFETIDWDAEGCELSFVDEYDSIEAAAEAADTMGLGIYMISEDTAGHYTHAVRVAHGSGPEVRSC